MSVLPKIESKYISADMPDQQDIFSPSPREGHAER